MISHDCQPTRSTKKESIMNGRDLARLFTASAMALEMNLKDLSHEDTLLQPPGGGNCMNWVIGHVLATRSQLFVMLGLEPFWSEDQTRVYERGSRPLTEPQQALPLDELRAKFRESQEVLLARLPEVTPAELETPLPEPGEILGDTVGSAADFLQWHEGYHMGQIGTLRRLAGRDGVIT
jgi:uncharacterized damage-inducible protein DinB